MTASAADEAAGSESKEPKVDGKPTATGDSETERTPGKVPAPEDVKELGGPRGPEPTRYGDWEKGGRCSDF